ncbi:MAG: acyl-CoA thiolase, partial [Sphingorhabdus sp.]
MTEVFLYDAVRTPRGKAKAGGGLGALTPHELVKQQIDALRARLGDVVNVPEALLLGCIGQVGDQGGHIGLVAKLHSGLPDATAAHSINNYCASGLSAIGQAAAMVGSSQAETVLAGGVECMSRVPFMADRASYYEDPNFPTRTRYIPVVLAADRLASAEGFSRAELDSVALASQQKAAAAEENAAMTRSRIPTGTLHAEECVRPTTDAASLAAMPTGFGALQDQYADALGGAHFEPLHTLSHAPPV